jgi:long-chain acyl-CoA synthetase
MLLNRTKLPPVSTPLRQLYRWERETPQQIFLRQPVDGQWIDYSYAQAAREVRSIAAALKALNLPPGSKVAILSKNCAHWIMADLAIWMAGHVSVPLYPTLTAGSIEKILEHSEARAIFIGKLDHFETQRPGIADHLIKISFPLYGINEGMAWHDLLNQQPLAGTDEPQPNEISTIKYTSGTTGIPKGVMITFGAFDYVLKKAVEGFALRPSAEIFFSYLPLSHIAERMLVELGGLYVGATICFSESLDKFSANLAEVQPTVFLAVPRIWAKFQEKILEKLPQKKLDRLMQIPLVSTLIKRTLKKKLGLSRARWIFTGASPIAKSLLEWYNSIGIDVREVYGMTENLAYSHNNLHEVRNGTVGKAWPDVETRVTEEGELLTRHPGMMAGYYKEPGQTAEVMTADGFLRTGDKVEVDTQGFTTITGRVKDLFKTDKGKYIAPSPIELKLAACEDVEQVCVVGMGIPQPIALVVLSAVGKSKSQENLQRDLAAALQQVNAKLESYERLAAAVIMQSDWTVDNGLMTPTLKVRRAALEKIHLPHYPKWFAQQQLVVWE